MTKMAIDAMEKIRVEHQELYQKAALLAVTVRREDAHDVWESLRGKIQSLLTEIRKLSGTVEAFEDYEWLAGAAIQWEVLLSSAKDMPHQIDLSRPPSVPGYLSLAQTSVLSEEELKNQIVRLAQAIGYGRIALLHRLSAGEEMNRDWRYAEAALIFEILDGATNFAGRVGPESYWRLEQEWLKYIKCVDAHRRWLARGAFPAVSNPLTDYEEACKHLRALLANPSMKAAPGEFLRVRAYLEERYLDKSGKLRRDTRVKEGLIGRKANRLWGTSGRDIAEANWLDAESYVVGFYESILPAVSDRDFESTRRVLRALSTGDPVTSDRMINCFETAISIYFLDAATVEALWAADCVREATL
jgi:hypothetical protein